MLDLTRSLGRWCFGCFNLRRDGQCYSNVDPNLWTSPSLIDIIYPCVGLNYKATTYPISSPHRAVLDPAQYPLAISDHPSLDPTKAFDVQTITDRTSSGTTSPTPGSARIYSPRRPPIISGTLERKRPHSSRKANRLFSWPSMCT